MKALILALATTAAVAPTPKPPQVCLPDPVEEAAFCPNSDTNYVFTVRTGCDAPKLDFHNCDAIPADNPDDLWPAPNVEPGYDEHGPGPTDDGKPGAGAVDKTP